MEMQNITISLPKKTLRKIKMIAVQRETSVSRMVADVLERIANEETAYNEAQKSALAMMEKGFDLGFEKPASREELHDRKH
jgi:metal-responsive CopG/Arc/MetJ family transcriptional regulator